MTTILQRRIFVFFFSGGGGRGGCCCRRRRFVENGFDIFRVATPRGQEQHLDQFFLFFLGECALLLLLLLLCRHIYMYIFIECISLLCHDSTRFFFIPMMMMMMMMMFLSFFLSFLSFVVVLQKYVSYHILPRCGCGSAIFCQKKKKKKSVNHQQQL